MRVASATVGQHWTSRAALLACLSATACTSTVLLAARDRAVTDLGCPAEEIRTYRASGGVIVARGCGHWLEYGCIRGRDTAVCMRDGPLHELPPEPPTDVKPRAADLAPPR